MNNYKDKKQFRYKEYDYSSDGFYFITICTEKRKMFFGKFEEENLTLSKLGKIADEYWKEIPKHFKNVSLDYYVVMPNHFHGIIQIKSSSENNWLQTQNRAVPCSYGEKNFSKFGRVVPKSLSSIVGSYKSIVSKIIRKNYPGLNFSWQTRFYDRIIRNDEELNKIRQYIIDNPLKWHLDRNNPDNINRTGQCPVPTNDYE